jgi:hypothetical protein
MNSFLILHAQGRKGDMQTAQSFRLLRACIAREGTGFTRFVDHMQTEY